MTERRIFLEELAVIGLLYRTVTQVRVRRGKVPIVEGDALWVAEPWSTNELGETIYQADGRDAKWSPAVTMAREDARLVLRVLAVRDTRALDVQRADAWAEGWPTEWDRRSAWPSRRGDPFNDGADVHVIRVVRVRHPLEIVDDLERWGSLDARRDHLFAELRHNLRALDDTRGAR